jgi:hypothetical protein
MLIHSLENYKVTTLANNEIVKNIFTRDKKCILNTDLDGLISGMLLQKFLNWKVVGFSHCNGKPDDELWLYGSKTDLSNYVFVDLPVCVDELTVIDQHFILFDQSSVERFNRPKNKLNPNVIRERLFKNASGSNEYTKKYPFGTAHFILAVLEHLKIIPADFTFDFRKNLGSFDLADLILRADRVIGNTVQYTSNCFDWANWILSIGGANTKNLFTIVEKEFRSRQLRERDVEAKVLNLGCSGNDGDCANLFRSRDYLKLNRYFDYLSDSLGLEKIPLSDFINLGTLFGRRIININSNPILFETVKNETTNKDTFSFALVNMQTLSITYKKD